MKTITDHKGLVWTRSEDGKRLTCENGMAVNGTKEMTNEYLLYVAYLGEELLKSSEKS